jgi:predicted alpha/beta-hydrolase family hydrolase
MRDDPTDFTPFAADPSGLPPVRGFLHAPVDSSGGGLVLTHGAGGNCRTALLVAISRAFAAAGFHVLRCDLPFRQARATGPPSPAGAARDRAGLQAAVHAMRELGARSVVLSGLSYGGRQVSMLAADAPELAQALLLFSYPLHPPGKPEAPRTEHLPRLRTPTVFVFGTRDPFGSPAEIRQAVTLVPAPTVLVEIDGAGHDLSRSRRVAAETHREVAARALEALRSFLLSRGSASP